MKSFNNLIRSTESTNQIESWTPLEIAKTEYSRMDQVRNNLSMFQLDNDPRKKIVNSRLIKAAEGLNEAQSWIPSEVEVQPEKKTFLPVNEVVEQPDPQLEVDRIIAEAKSRADEIIAEAQDSAKKIRQEALQEGLDNAKNEMRETLQAAVSVINVAREWRSDMMSQAEPMIMDLVKKMAQKMFGEGVALDPITLQQHFSSVLESARSLDDLRIYMHPDDVLALGPDWREYQVSLLGHKVEIISNDSIKRGGCYIQGEWGTADALVETQLNAILNQLSEAEQPDLEEE